jgi:hypothetical protein
MEWGKEVNTQCQNLSEQTHLQATSKAGQVVDEGADLLNQRAAFKIKLAHLAGGGAE